MSTSKCKITGDGRGSNGDKMLFLTTDHAQPRKYMVRLEKNSAHQFALGQNAHLVTDDTQTPIMLNNYKVTTSKNLTPVAPVGLKEQPSIESMTLPAPTPIAIVNHTAEEMPEVVVKAEKPAPKSMSKKAKAKNVTAKKKATRTITPVKKKKSKPTSKKKAASKRKLAA